MKICQALLLLAGAAAVASAQEPLPLRATLVRDFNTAEVEISSSPRDFVAVNGKVYFSATRPSSGRELFAVDADGGQPYLVAELAPGGASSNPRVLGVAGGRIIVAARAGNTDHDDLIGPPAAYSVDPASGEIVMVNNFPPEGMGSFGNKVLLYTDYYDNALVATDGTVQGTQRLLKGLAYDFSAVPHTSKQICLLPDRIMFVAPYQGSHHLWVSNGETLGTGVIMPLPGWAPFVARATDGGCYFLANRENGGWDLWLTNGTAGGTGIVATSVDGRAHDLAVLGGVALVTDYTDQKGQMRLWRADSATPLLQHTGIYPGYFHISGNRVLIGAQTMYSEPVFVSDGTPAGTRRVEYPDGAPLLLTGNGSEDLGFVNAGAGVLVSDAHAYRIDPATALVQRFAEQTPINFSDSASLGETVLGAAYAPGLGLELWRSDGTAAGTQPLADLARANGGSMGSGEAVSQGNVLVLSRIDDGATPEHHRGGMWRTDGTAAGTWALPRLFYGEGAARQVRALGYDILFSADVVPSSGLRQLYRTRADFLETTQLTTTRLAGPEFLQSVGAGNSSALFLCGQPQVQRDLCAIGADADPIVPLQYALPATPRPVGSVGNYALYFVPGQGLFRTDGTLAGTWFLRPGLLPHPDVANYPLRSLLWGSRLLFQGCEGSVCSLWASDGTPGGTVALSSRPGSFVHDYAQLGNRVLFLTTEPRATLWQTDGTEAGTRVVTQLSQRMLRLVTVGSFVHLANDRLLEPYIVSDGTAAGTVYAPFPPAVFPSFGVPVVLDENTAVFRCTYNAHGQELCAIDADGSNLRVVADIFPGPVGSMPEFVGRTSDALYFSADDGAHGSELWRLARLTDALFADGFD